MKKCILPILVLIIALIISGCDISGKVDKEDGNLKSKLIEIKEAKMKDAEIGLVSPRLDYASDSTIVFHDYFGLFVYSLKNEKIIKSINIKDLGFENTVGDNALVVSFNEENSLLYLYSLNKDNAIEVYIDNNKAKKIDAEEIINESSTTIKGTLKIATKELRDLLYKPDSGDKQYFPLKDFK